MATPVMFVGAGTGIAPLRGMIREREFWSSARLWSAEGAGQRLDGDGYRADNTLVFGCRKEAKDFYYAEEWAGVNPGAANPNTLRVLTAFSQDQRNKIYVQKVVREADGTELLANHLLVHKGALYIAGGTKMAKAVKEEVVEALEARLEGGRAEAIKFLAILRKRGLFCVEAW